jgi:hypothetical protein
MVDICHKFDNRVIGLAKVFPGENADRLILQEAFSKGLRGLKLHAQVQCVDIKDLSLAPLLDCSQLFSV